MSNPGGWTWIEGEVNREVEHITLSYDSGDGEAQPVLAAILSPPKTKTFTVQFLRLSPPEDVLPKEALEEVRKELDLYLLTVGGVDPWAYALYHCRTASNAYSRVHWGWNPGAAPDTFKT